MQLHVPPFCFLYPVFARLADSAILPFAINRKTRAFAMVSGLSTATFLWTCGRNVAHIGRSGQSSATDFARKTLIKSLP
jgi:hypothetical protein